MLRAVSGAGGSGSGGDIVGPASSTLNAFPRFADTTGKLLKDTSGIKATDNFAITVAGATVTANEPVLSLTQTWNNAGVTFYGLDLQVTATASAAASRIFRVRSGASTAFDVNTVGSISFPGSLGMGSGSTNPVATLNGGTATASTAPLSITQTWNNAGVTFNGMLMNITNTASAAASTFLDLQVGGTSQFQIRRTGEVRVTATGNNNLVAYGLNNAVNSGMWLASNSICFGVGGGQIVAIGSQAISSNGIRTVSGNSYGWVASTSDPTGATDTFLTRPAAATIQHGAASAASPVAQTIATQGSRAGTDSNVGGASLTIQPGIGTGTGTPSNLILNGIVGTTTGSGTQAVSAGLTVAGVGTGQLPSVVVGSAALATNATDGFLYIPTCAGTPTGVPTARTGRIAMVYDTTNHQFWFYDGAWLQPKTPAAAAIVTWQ